MKIEEVLSLIEGVIVEGQDSVNEQIDCVFASDLMSDVLTIRNDKNLMLITGLANLQTIRTCEMSDIKIILFVRGKKVNEEMMELAKENEMILIETKFSLYKTSGILYNAGIAPVY
ncbi:MAG: hypothetical protein RR356_06705 [Bacteroidales bacterium]